MALINRTKKDLRSRLFKAFNNYLSVRLTVASNKKKSMHCWESFSELGSDVAVYVK